MSFLHRVLPQPSAAFQPYDASSFKDLQPRRGSDLLDHKIMAESSFATTTDPSDTRPRSIAIATSPGPHPESSPPDQRRLSSASFPPPGLNSNFASSHSSTSSLLASLDQQRRDSQPLLHLRQHHNTAAMGINDRRNSSPTNIETVSPSTATTGSSFMSSGNSSETSPQFCLCQPDPKIPRPRNGE